METTNTMTKEHWKGENGETLELELIDGELLEIRNDRPGVSAVSIGIPIGEMYERLDRLTGARAQTVKGDGTGVALPDIGDANEERTWEPDE